ncbi:MULTISPECIES: hypothetical protein [Nocardia]|uniref:hypothetical protein n=1 Tax=Nocardia asiatica TaxID=209252 RepID=UPI0002FCF41E
MEQARSEGLSLTGADGLLTAVTRRVIEAALEAEMTEHLGYSFRAHRMVRAHCARSPLE